MSNRVIDIEVLREEFNFFVTNCSRCPSSADKQTVMRAFDMAAKAFQGIKKNSGEYYIEHSVAVAKIVAQEIGLGPKSIISAMLHDVLDETDLQLEEVEKSFGPKTAAILSALTKIREVIDGQGVMQAEAFRQVLLTLSDDIRVIFIKIADRLHHMRTLKLYSERIQARTVNESLRVYVPLAHRLGLYNIKTELEDLSLKYTHPDLYEEINSQIVGTERARTQLITNFSLPIITELDKRGFNFDIAGRTKSVYSIWHKMQKKHVSFKEIYDVFAIRIVFTPSSPDKEIEECWEIFNLIEGMENRQIKQDRTRDWLLRPKANGYSALHLTVLYKEKYWIEVQIRSKRMDDIAEVGFASHWKYKGIEDKESDLDLWIKEIKEKLNSMDNSSQEFFDSFNLDGFSSEILVFSSKGQVVSLPKNATVLDFAFKINPKTAFHCIGAKLGKNLVSRDHQLNSGDIIEILSSDTQEPKPEWALCVKTPQACKILNNYFLLKRNAQVESGRNTFKKIIVNNRIDIDKTAFKKLFSHFMVNNKEDLFQKIAVGEIKQYALIKALRDDCREQFVKSWKLEFENYEDALRLKSINPNMDENNFYTFSELAKCCYPLPGDRVVAIRIPGGKIKLHKEQCKKLKKESVKNEKKLIDVKWTHKGILSHLYRIKLEGKDRFGVINQLSTILTIEFNTNIKSFYFDARDDIFSLTIDVYVSSQEVFSTLIARLESIDSFNVQIARSLRSLVTN